MAAEGELVLGLARDVEPLGDLLGRLGHVEPAVRVLERREEQVLERRLDAEAEALAGTAQNEGRLAHVLHAAAQSRLRLAQLNQLRALDDRLDPRTAEPVHGDGRDTLRQPSENDRHSGHITIVLTCLVCAARKGLVDVSTIHTCPRQGFRIGFG